MYPTGYDSGECTADAGIGGWNGCRRWPGCGCGGEAIPFDQESPSSSTQFVPYYPQSKWLRVDSVQQLQDGTLTLMGRPVRWKPQPDGRTIPHKVLDGYMVLLRSMVEGKSLGDILEPVDTFGGV